MAATAPLTSADKAKALAEIAEQLREGKITPAQSRALVAEIRKMGEKSNASPSS